MEVPKQAIVDTSHLENIYWMLLGGSLLFYVPINIDDARVLSFGMFDVAVAVIFSIELMRRRIAFHPVMYWAIGIGFVIVLFACTTFLYRDEIHTAGVIRETIKYISFVAILTMSALLFVGPLSKAPPGWVLFLLGLLIIVVWPLQATVFMTESKSALVVNVYSNIGIGLGIFAVYFLRDRLDGKVWSWLLLYHLSILYFAVWKNATGHSIAAAIILAVLLFSCVADQFQFSRKRTPFVFAVLGLLVGAICLVPNWDAIFQAAQFHFRGGIAIRAALWLSAIEMIGVSFPFGIGPGQFGNIGITEIQLANTLPPEFLRLLDIDQESVQEEGGQYFGHLQIRFVHNAFLAMLLEWGLVGAGIMCLLIYLIVNAFRVFGCHVLSICFACYLVPSLLLNDGLGFRLGILILAICLAVRLRTLSMNNQ